jgi:hypothetical protein
MEEVKTTVQCRHDVRLMTRSDERITLDEAFGGACERFGVVPGDLVSSQERPEAMPNWAEAVWSRSSGVVR